MESGKAPIKLKGRGAGGNPANRFEKLSLAELPLEARDDLDPSELPAPRTRFFRDHSRSILTRNESPDVGFSLSINPYRGCEHGCAYCYARPTHEYLGMSAGIDFETKIFIKEDAPALLRAELMKRSYSPETINLSGVTDCYQPVERRLGLTRRCLEVLREFGNPFVIITKNQAVTRDLDVIGEMGRQGAAAVFVSVTSLDPAVTAVLEPRTARPAARLAAIRALADAGVPVGAMMAPVIPGLTDHELPALLHAAREAGARFAGFTPVRLPLTVLPIFKQWVETHFPDRAGKIIHRISEIRGGKMNDARFGHRMRGEGPWAESLRALFRIHCRREGLNRESLELTTAHFRRPGEQLALF